jgi:menaquinone-dependent protoporphyrinogen oxidase
MAGGATVVIAGGGLLASGLDAPSADAERVRAEIGGKTVAGKKVLVAYASKCGSTGEVARAIAEEIGKTGLAVDVQPVREVISLEGYGAVVLGSAVRMGNFLPEATSFLKRNAQSLPSGRVAYFSVGTSPLEKDPEKREQEVAHPFAAWRSIHQPVETAAFAGAVDKNKLGFPWKLMIGAVKEGPLAGGDFRDWNAIRGWAAGIAPKVAG